MRRCRKCGCTDDNACIHLKTNEDCHWVENDLCSACLTDQTRKLYWPPQHFDPRLNAAENSHRVPADWRPS